MRHLDASPVLDSSESLRQNGSSGLSQASPDGSLGIPMNVQLVEKGGSEFKLCADFGKVLSPSFIFRSNVARLNFGKHLRQPQGSSWIA
jgi:hypothetical protein